MNALSPPRQARRLFPRLCLYATSKVALREGTRPTRACRPGPLTRRRGLMTLSTAWRLRQRKERGIDAAGAWVNPKGPAKFLGCWTAQTVKRPEVRAPDARGAGLKTHASPQGMDYRSARCGKIGPRFFPAVRITEFRSSRYEKNGRPGTDQVWVDARLKHRAIEALRLVRGPIVSPGNGCVGQSDTSEDLPPVGFQEFVHSLNLAGATRWTRDREFGVYSLRQSQWHNRIGLEDQTFVAYQHKGVVAVCDSAQPELCAGIPHGPPHSFG